ncbi:MAG: tetratricopeptide repeat protein [Pseudobdellovibrio sp.]
MSKKIFISLFLLGSVSYAQTESLSWPSPKSFYYDYKARKALQNKQPNEALEYTLKILENEPMAAQIHSNLGVILDQMEKKEDAEKAFIESMRLVELYKDQLHPADLFQIYYNLGVKYGADKKIPQALEAYQKALDIDPTSTETKHNIELLMQQQSGQGQGENKNQDQQNENQQKQDQQNKDQKNKDQKKDSKDNKDNRDKKQDKPEDEKENEKEQDQKNNQNDKKEAKQSPKYKPRPFKGDQLSEGDVKKILGELDQQDKKIRSNFNKKERKEDRNEKDW